jgi:hypothetical protein
VPDLKKKFQVSLEKKRNIALVINNQDNINFKKDPTKDEK